MKIILSWDLPHRYTLDSMLATKLPFFTPDSGILHPEEDWKSFVLIWTHVEDHFEEHCNPELSIFEISVSPVFEEDQVFKKELILIGRISLPGLVFCSGIAFASTESSPMTVLLKNEQKQESCSCEWTGTWPVVITGTQDGLNGSVLAIQDLNSAIQKNSITESSSCKTGEILEQQEVQNLQQGRIYYHSITPQETTGPITGLSCKGSTISNTGFLTSEAACLLEMKSELKFTRVPTRCSLEFTRKILVLDDTQILLLGEYQISLIEIGTVYDVDALARGEDAELGQAAFEQLCEELNLCTLFSGVCQGRFGLDFKSLEDTESELESELVFYTSTGGVYSNNSIFKRKRGSRETSE